MGTGRDDAGAQGALSHASVVCVWLVIRLARKTLPGLVCDQLRQGLNGFIFTGYVDSFIKKESSRDAHVFAILFHTIQFASIWMHKPEMVQLKA
jgi:hypothetical protein